MQIVIFNFENCSAIELEKRGSTASFLKSFDARNENRKKSYWAARYAAGCLLQRAKISGLVSQNSQLGFPILVDEKGNNNVSHYINFSHTETTVTVALSHHPVGIDIENLNRNAENATQRILSEKEKTSFSLLNKKIKLQDKLVAKALLYWVLKESVAKATGLGMSKGLELFEIETLLDGLYSVTTPPEAPFIFQDAKCAPFIVDNFLLSVCTEGASFRGGIFGGGPFFRLLDLNGKLEQLN